MAALTWGHVRKSTPTAGLEIFGYLPPVDLWAKAEAVRAWFRVKPVSKDTWDGVGKTVQRRGHRRDLNNIIKHWNIPEHARDVIPVVTKHTRNYNVNIPSFEKGEDVPPGPLRVYTDGSKQKSKVGAGFAILKGEQFQTYDLTYLGTQTTVFQAEVFAIGNAAKFLLEK